MKSQFQNPIRKIPRVGIGIFSGTESEGTLHKHRTTLVERLSLMSIIVILPLQAYIPKFAGATAPFILFGLTGVYLLLWRPRTLYRTSVHPVFLAGYVLLFVGLLSEIAHESRAYNQLWQITLMILGAIVVASLCRDRKALRSCIYGFLIAGVFLSGVLVLTTYGQLSSVNIRDAQEADQFRVSKIRGHSLEADLNDVAFFAARGTVIALVFALTAIGSVRRYSFLVIGIFCLVGTFLPMSRSGVLMLVVSGAAVVYAYGIRQPKVFIAVGVLALGMVIWVPESAFSRFSVSTEQRHGEFVDSRTRIFMATMKSLPEYILTGVGFSNYYGKWGKQHGFAVGVRHTEGVRGSGVTGVHNSFLQITVYWGLAGLMALLLLVWQAYRCFPTSGGTDPLRLCLLGIVVSILVYSLFIHWLFAKEFSLALGMLVGGAQWIWPHHMASTGYQVRRTGGLTPVIKPGMTTFGVFRH